MTKVDDNLDKEICRKKEELYKLYIEKENLIKSPSYPRVCSYENNFNIDICLGRYENINLNFVCSYNKQCERQKQIINTMKKIQEINNEIDEIEKRKKRLLINL